MTQIWNLNFPFSAVVIIFFTVVIYAVGFFSTTVYQSSRSGKRYEYLTRIEYSHILWGSIGIGALEAIIFAKEAIRVPGNGFLKLVLFLLIIGLIVLMAFFNMAISAFGTNMGINAQIKEIEKKTR